MSLPAFFDELAPFLRAAPDATGQVWLRADGLGKCGRAQKLTDAPGFRLVLNFGRPKLAPSIHIKRMARNRENNNSEAARCSASLGPGHADNFRRDLRADHVLTNPPFNDSDTNLRASAHPRCEASPQVVRGAKDSWSKDNDVRWQFGVPPKRNANLAWVQHFIHHFKLDGNINRRQTLN